jgi:polygalacturonase
MRSKSELLLVTVLCLAGCQAAISDQGGGSTMAAVSKGSYVLKDDFNSLPAGSLPAAPWTLDTSPQGAVTLIGVPFAADLSVQIAKPDASGTSSLSTSFSALSGRVAFEAKVMSAETAGFKAIPYLYDGAHAAVASVAFQDGNIVTHIGNTNTIVMPFAANTWYRVRILADTNAGTFDLYVDGVRKEHDVALRSASQSIASLSYFMDAANVGTLYVDNVKVYTEAAYIGSAPTPVYDVRDYGAKGDGTNDDTSAIEAAIAALTAAGKGGSVLLTQGNYLSGTITLPSNMTFFIDSSAVLLGSTVASAYPTQSPNTGNTQLSNTRRALLYVPDAKNVTIDGGGVIDGQGDSGTWTGVENTRPLVIWSVLSDTVTVQNLYVRKGAVWSVVMMETDNVTINNINLQSDNITHDGIDIVDGTNITVENSAINAGDDAMCLKSGVRRGIDTIEIKDSVFTGNNGGSNGIKFGTATYGAFKNVSIHDDWVKDVQYAAMAVESRDGADIDGVTFNRIQFSDTGGAFFVYLAQQATTHPIGDVPKLGSITNVSFTDIAGSTSSYGNSPHQGSLITGQIYNGTTYSITNLNFTRVSVLFDGGSSVVPDAPVEAKPGQYPESNMFGDLPAWAFYLRHVDGVTFDDCSSAVVNADARQGLVTDDATNVTGTP